MKHIDAIEHPIQRSVIGVLVHTRYARFRDLRPERTDTNLFSYHLKALMKSGFILKQDAGYTLSTAGLAYVDRFSTKKQNLRTQPKIITMLVLHRDGKVLLQHRNKQPYIDTWTLPYGKTHISDTTINAAAHRELREKLDARCDDLRHAGDAYIRVTSNGEHLSTTLAHVFTGEVSVPMSDDVRWVERKDIEALNLAPAVLRILKAADSADRFFLECDEEWEIT